ncbi:response regulator [Pseudobacteriovorax antillogorgiicola]|uniref:Two-component system, chemotaxis family, response regulator CheY n=1 Tax=Pseudobacteriovorax antillogorgiicola TaxID=1513793 RepID=A0A1Y6BH03_9BACT|nr:response regulator [Pseudobacteriovorax antillogorgiicola]TCS56204.1 two-component system chemotaxis response regulator CheY [Pseudobacteriovorax antillogorgiicola]SMF08640.1 two-component system, chemotaxis family, response regulator CheY [Pseudobacteriovorax antillogorgiicola]
MAKILIVDDSETLRDQLRDVIEKAGHQVVEGHHGRHGCEVAEANQDIDLIISDFNMPELDGISMIKRIKEQAQFKETPAFMLTTESTKELMQQGKEAGVMAWIVKPFDEEEIIEAIDAVLEDAA